LALGIGANTAIFTLLNAVMLKTLPVPNPHELVLFSDSPSEGTSTGDLPVGEWNLFSNPVYEYFRDHNDSFQELAAFRSGESALSVRVAEPMVGEAATRAQGHLVSGNFFSVMGVDAFRGRNLTPDDDRPGATPAVVISYGYWKEKFNTDPAVIGSAVVLNGNPFTIVGVAPPQFFGARVRRSTDFWIPLVFHPQIEMRESFLVDEKVHWLNMIGRLRPGIEIDQAQSTVNGTLQQFLMSRAGEELTEDRRRTLEASHVQLRAGGQGISGLRFFYADSLRMLMIIVGLVLLIVCANVGNLLLSRSASRQMEIAMRRALGASASRLARQLLTESVLLALLGGVLGILFASWGVGVLVGFVARTAPIDVSPDSTVMTFTAGVSLLAGILFGLAPAIRSSRGDLATALKVKATRSGGGRSRFGLASILVVSQVAVSLVLLAGAGLFVRSLLMLQKADIGFDKENVLLVDIDPRLAGYTPTQLSALYQQLLDRINALPSVRSASISSFSPLSGNSRTSTISVQGYVSRENENMVVSHLLIGPRYAETLGLPVLMGRQFGIQDTPASQRVAVVNEAFAQYFFKDENPIGRRFGFSTAPESADDIEIVGVVGNAKHQGVDKEPVRTAYLPVLQIQDQSAYSSNIEIRTDGDPRAAASDVRSTIAQVDGTLPIVNVYTFAARIDASLGQQRMSAQLVSFFGLLALVLACVGLYGVMSSAVSRRTNEIGIRMALGAERRSILWMVLRETMLLVLVGMAIGVPGSLGFAGLVSTQLYGIDSADPMTIVAAAICLTLVAVLAGYLPARRASRVDPLVALRYE
jgi:predicted permease